MSSVAAFSCGFGRAGRSKETLFTCVVVLGSFPQGLSHLSGVEASEQCSKRVKVKLQVLRPNSDCTPFVPLHSVGQPSQRPSQIQGMEKTDSINRLPLIMIIDYHYCQIQLKKGGKTTRPLKYDRNQIPFDYTVEVTNRFKALDQMDRVPEELWMEVHATVWEAGIKTITMEKK